MKSMLFQFKSFTTFHKALRRSAKRGMTLIEIMVVMAIIAIIGTAVAFGVLPALSGAQEDAAKTQISQISKALDLYYMRHSELPQGLEALVENESLKAEQLNDPWKKPFQYRIVGTRKYSICSGGEDGSIGGTDDVCNAEK